jgi:hypothetical protein
MAGFGSMTGRSCATIAHSAQAGARPGTAAGAAAAKTWHFPQFAARGHRSRPGAAVRINGRQVGKKTSWHGPF